VLKLAADGAFRWVQTMSTLTFSAMAVRPDSSLVVAGRRLEENATRDIAAFVTKLESDSTSAWSFLLRSIQSGGTAPSITDVAAGASTFMLAGGTDTTAEADPSPAIHAFGPGTTFVIRYQD
jgi:hypothetical protein